MSHFPINEILHLKVICMETLSAREGMLKLIIVDGNKFLLCHKFATLVNSHRKATTWEAKCMNVTRRPATQCLTHLNLHHDLVVHRIHFKCMLHVERENIHRWMHDYTAWIRNEHEICLYASGVNMEGRNFWNTSTIEMMIFCLQADICEVSMSISLSSTKVPMDKRRWTWGWIVRTCHNLCNAHSSWCCLTFLSWKMNVFTRWSCLQFCDKGIWFPFCCKHRWGSMAL